MWKPLILTHSVGKFNNRRSCGSTDITYSICGLTLQDYVNEGSCDFMEKSCTLYVTNPLGVLIIDIVVMEISFKFTK